VSNNCTFFDTAEVYGRGESERRVGQYIAALPTQKERDSIAIATKFIPLPYHVPCLGARSAVVSHLRGSLNRMGVSKVALFQIHSPALSITPVETWAHGLADALDAGLCEAVGVSNYNSDQVSRTEGVLQIRGYHLSSNQVEFSLLKRRPETSGLIGKCRALNIAVLAYSPMAMGRLTGKPIGRERYFAADGYTEEQLQAVVGMLRAVGEGHDNATAAQIALAWCVAKGVVPIAGAKTAHQAEQNVRGASIELTPEEVSRLDALAVDGVRGGAVSFWQTSALDEL